MNDELSRFLVTGHPEWKSIFRAVRTDSVVVLLSLLAISSSSSSGAILWTVTGSLGLLVAGFSVGFISTVIILYMSEIAYHEVGDIIVFGCQFCITIGIMLASCVDHRIPIALPLVM